MNYEEEQIARASFEKQLLADHPNKSMFELVDRWDSAGGAQAHEYKRGEVETLWKGFLMGLKAKKLTNPFKVRIDSMTENVEGGERKTHIVTLINSEQRPKKARLLDQTGIITPFASVNEEHAKHEATAYAEFLGVAFPSCTCVMCKHKGKRKRT